MPMPRLTRRHYLIAGAAIVAIGVLAWLRTGASATEFGSGTITAIDTTARSASIEVVIPSTGATRELTGSVPENCVIEINGKSATLNDLRVGERVQVAARIDRNATTPDGKRKTRFTVEHVRVERRTADKL